MSDRNSGLNFYIMYGPDDTYCLFNAATDKDILFGEDRETVESFLMMNNPSHPFLLNNDTSYEPLTFSMNEWAGADSSYDSLLDPYFKTSVYDTSKKDIDYSQTLKNLGVDSSFNNSIARQQEEDRDPRQLELPFMNEFRSIVKSLEEESNDDTPYLPEDE